MKPVSPDDGEALPRELTDLLIGLSNAIHKHAMYPDGHPMLVSVATGLARQLSAIFEQRAALAIGVSPTQLIVAGHSTDPQQMVLRDLASRLHRRNIGAVKLYRGVKPEEVEALLRVIARETELADDGAPVERRWPHIRLHPLSYSQLELIGEGGGEGGVSSWANGIWHTLATAALETELELEQAATKDPAALARAIEARAGEPAYGQRIASCLTDLMDACRARGGAEAMALETRLSQLVSNLSPEALERLVSLEPNEAERTRFLLDMSQAMAVDAVMDLVQAAANASSRSISPALVQLLGKMATYAQQDTADARKVELAFRQQVRSLIEGWEDWDAQDPAPGEYQRTLDRLSAAGKNPLRGVSHHYECEPERTLSLSLEIGTATDATRQAAAHLLQAGQLQRLLDLLDRSPNYGLATELRHQVVTDGSLRHALERVPVEYPAVATLSHLLGESAIPLLLEHFMGLEDGEAMGQMMTILRGAGEVVGRRAVEMMGDQPWPAQRNLLTLIASLPALPPGFAPAEFTRNQDPGVRQSAIRILLSGPATRTRAICDALAAEDTATIRLGITAAVDHCPAAAVPLLIRQIEDGDFESGVKAAAVRAIAPVTLPIVLDCLIGLALTRTLVLRRRRLAGRSAVVLAAIAGLRRHWSTNPRAREVLELAQASSDPEVQAVAGPPAS